jgi:hypothetical protein
MLREIHVWKVFNLTPLLQNREPLPEEVQAVIGKGKAARPLTPLEDALLGLYVNAEGKYYHPAIGFKRAMECACKNETITELQPNGKPKQFKAVSVVNPNVWPAEEEFVLMDPATMNGKREKAKPLSKRDMLVDSRRAGEYHAMVHRAKWKAWGGYLPLWLDVTSIMPETLSEVLERAGLWGIRSGRLNNIKGKWGGLGMGQFHVELIE